MNPTVNEVNTSANPNVVKTILDGVREKAFNELVIPGQVNYMDTGMFMQEQSDKLVEQEQLFVGIGGFTEVEELAEADSDNFTSPESTKRNFTMTKFMKDIGISSEFEADDQHRLVERAIKGAVRAELDSRNRKAFGVWNDAFAGTTYTTVTGLGAQPLISNSHTTIGGATVDNLTTGALSTTSYDAAVVLLQEQVDYRGIHAGHMPACLAVSPTIRGTAERIVNSMLLPGTGNNDLNPVAALYGINIKTTPFLGAAFGGSNTQFFVMGTEHTVIRYEREATNTTLVEAKYSKTDKIEYRIKYRETVGIMSYDGVTGSTGL